MENQISQQPLNDYTLSITLGKVLDNTNAYEMVQAIQGAQTRGFTHIIVDMANLEFLSSAGVGSILGTIDSFREVGGDIVVCNMSSHILHVFEVLDLTGYLTIAATEAEAAEQCQIKG